MLTLIKHEFFENTSHRVRKVSSQALSNLSAHTDENQGQRDGRRRQNSVAILRVEQEVHQGDDGMSAYRLT